MLAWGDALLTYYGKERERAWRVDPTLRYLGYATDNGACRHYGPTPPPRPCLPAH